MSQLITIGGDDTAYSAMMLLRHAAGALRVVHVPKTIDNDLFLPDYIVPSGSSRRATTAWISSRT